MLGGKDIIYDEQWKEIMNDDEIFTGNWEDWRHIDNSRYRGYYYDPKTNNSQGYEYGLKK